MYYDRTNGGRGPEFREYIGCDVSNCVKKGLRKERDPLFKIIRSEEFDKDIFVSWISGTEDYERIHSDRCKPILKYNGFRSTQGRILNLRLRDIGSTFTVIYSFCIVKFKYAGYGNVGL